MSIFDVPVVRGFNVSIMVSDIDPQGSFPYTVNIKVTYPLSQSFGPRLYFVSFWLLLLKYPSPNVVHITDESFVDIPCTI